jgi:hypothetical protein
MTLQSGSSPVRSTGEGDRRKAVEGAGLDSVPVAAPSTMLRMVPLPGFAREDPDCESHI